MKSTQRMIIMTMRMQPKKWLTIIRKLYFFPRTIPFKNEISTENDKYDNEKFAEKNLGNNLFPPLFLTYSSSTTLFTGVSCSSDVIKLIKYFFLFGGNHDRF